jgi:hypothetical protein
MILKTKCSNYEVVVLLKDTKRNKYIVDTYFEYISNSLELSSHAVFDDLKEAKIYYEKCIS